MYDGTALHMSTADAPDTVIARADTCGFTTQPWEVTEYRASITSTEVWLRINSEYGEHLIDVCPFWGQRPAAITFAAGEHAAALPVIACPTAPDDRRPWHGRDRGKDRDVNGRCPRCTETHHVRIRLVGLGGLLGVLDELLSPLGQDRQVLCVPAVRRDRRRGRDLRRGRAGAGDGRWRRGPLPAV
ncbi:hypothetical protein [Streptomyces canus]|uniref:hypothetical protein n=1 Tax=Streptomyces canus TaxID=58343 RepID=UPI00277D61EC|nr:hypothetical protein [Streptomyces canus]MDQ1073742.1 hypothetical protein [Streptomyces canus]